MEKFLSKIILIVEDDPSLLLSLKSKFEKEGFKVLTATNGKDGLKIAKSEKIDLILIDILLPEMDGISMAKEINKLKLGLPMIFLTNLSDIEHISKAITENTTDYLVKADWNINDVVDRVRERLKIK